MKSKIIIGIIFFLVFIQSDIIATTVTIKSAKLVAKNFYFTKSTVNYDQITFSDEFVILDQGAVVYYVFNLLKDQGFVIVAADERVYPILGYSLKSNYKHSNQPSAFKNWTNNYKEQISYVIENDLTASPDIVNTWVLFNSTNYSHLRNNLKRSYVVAPLLGDIAWNQNAEWNNACPQDNASQADNDRVYTGCVPTAAGQIMKYYHHPYRGTGSFSYDDPTYGTLSADFNTVYDFANMPATQPTPELARLLYHLAVGIETEFGPVISTSNITKAINLLKNNFYYKSTAKVLLKGNYSDGDWINLLKDELNNDRPILYSGTGSYGHSFVCDGYDDSNPVMFHFNWGWSGDNNGTFLITNLNPGLYNFSNDQKAGIEIEPNNSNVPTCNFSSDIKSSCGSQSINFYDQSSNVPNSWLWTFEGGNPSSSTSENPVVTYNAPGSYTVSLTSSNNIGTGSTITKTSYIKIYDGVISPDCAPETQYFGYYWYGIYNVSFGNIYNTTSMKPVDRGYHDYSCTYTTLLSPTKSTDLTLTVGHGLSGDTKVKAFIDYNNDGDFEDPGENILTSSVPGPESSKQTFTTSIPVPTNIIENTLLRMRIITDQEPITNSCFDPYTGQAEDYGVCFSSKVNIETYEMKNSSGNVKIYSVGADIYINILNEKDITVGSVVVYNLLGEIVYQTSLYRSGNKITIDNIQDGVYFVKVFSGGNNIYKSVYLYN